MTPGLDRESRRYLAHSYPHNHDYRVVGSRLVPSWKLWRREGRLRALYPRSPRSLVDLASCKGWFVLQAARAGCPRAVGLDVHRPDLDASRAAAAHLRIDADFREQRLDELAAEVEAGAAPFEVALLVNAYQYFYFGSDRDERAVLDHRWLFQRMRTVCSGRLIFSNRVDLERLPDNVRERERAVPRGAALFACVVRAQRACSTHKG
ncbi:MAG: class I SAM-dependent methyltransferase, partial [Planctomycetes bacterium]|nr:class I SAM-dependent methyltransferase [Planctomycetota bacterium]